MPRPRPSLTVPALTAAVLGLLAATAHASGPSGGSAPADDDNRPILELPCQRWEGTLSGNDDAAATLVLCGEGSVVTGLFETLSPRSGHSIRRIQGMWFEDKLLFEDRNFALYEANAPWYFCLCDGYRFERDSANGLAGYFDSTECDDHATVNLTWVGRVSTPPEL